MEVHSITYHGWRDNTQTVEKRITYDYEKGNDVTVVENRSYTIMLYASDGKMENPSKGNHVDEMV